MSSGIFGPRAPSYLPPSSNYFAQGTTAYSVGSPTSYVSRNSSHFRAPSGYSASPQYSSLPQYISYTAQPLPPTTPYPGHPYSASPAEFGYAGALPQYPPSMYSYAQHYGYGIAIPSKGLEAILVAILVLVSLDLVIIRPLKQSH